MKRNKILNLLLAGSIATSAVAYTSSLVEATTSTGIDIATQATNTSQEVSLVATYKVPVKSLTSKAPIPAVQQAFSKAFGDEIIVKEYSDGTYKATVTLQHMQINFMQTFEANVTSVAGATVLSTKKELSSNPGDNIAVPPTNTEIEVPETVEFALDLDENNKQVLEITVDFMDAFMGDGEPYPTNVTLELDMDNKVELTDKELLKATIDEANAAIKGDFTESSINYVQGYINTAQEVYDNDQATQQEIDAATQNLKDALTKLVKVLEDGTYQVEASFVKENSEDLSMANAALKSATLKVVNGKTYVELEVQPMSMYGQTAAIDKLEVFDENTNQYVEATIEETDQDGKPSKFSFELPTNSTYTKVQFTYFGHSSVARLKLDLDGLVNVTVDKTLLKTKIDEANAISSASYTSASYEVLAQALIHANVVYNNENATQDEVNQEVTALQTALDQLVARPTSGIELLDEDGVYQVPVYLWNATSDKASMAASALEQTAKIEVKNGVKTMTIYTKEMTMGNITAFLQELKVAYGDDYVNIEPSSYDANGNPTSFTFELPHTNEYIAVKMNPHVAMMGNMDLDARIKVDYANLTVLEDGKTPATTPSQTTSSSSNTSSTTSGAVDTGNFDSTLMMMALAGLSVTGAYCLVKTKKED